MHKTMNLERAVIVLRGEYNLDVESPFLLVVNGEKYKFDCLIRGFGAKNGMIIDRDWSAIEPASEELIQLDYGFSCFDVRGGVENMKLVLKDWGKV